jgi:hypothetical protein
MVLACLEFPLCSMLEILLCWLLLQGLLVPVHYRRLLLLLMAWVTHHKVVGVAALMVGVARSLLVFSVAIVKSQRTSRLIAIRRCWTWAMLL